MALPVSDPEELVSHAGTTPHDLAKDGDDKKVFVALLSGKDCECLWLQDRTIRQLKEEAQQKLDIAIKHLIGPDMEPLDEEKMLAEENVMPGTTLTVVAVNQAAEDEKEAAKCNNNIFHAAMLHSLGGVRHLLRTVPGAVAATDCSGGTALHKAAAKNRAETCRVLLAAGAELEARDARGNTPLHWAARNGRAEAVKLLLEAKASVTVKDDKGKTPLDDARSRGHDKIVRMLERAA